MEFKIFTHGHDKADENEVLSIDTDFGVTKFARLNYEVMQADEKRKEEAARFKLPRKPGRPRKR